MIVDAVVVEPESGREITLDEAVDRGIIDQSQRRYVNPVTGKTMSIFKAIDAGRIRVRRSTEEVEEEVEEEGGMKGVKNVQTTIRTLKESTSEMYPIEVFTYDYYRHIEVLAQIILFRLISYSDISS